MMSLSLPADASIADFRRAGNKDRCNYRHNYNLAIRVAVEQHIPAVDILSPSQAVIQAEDYTHTQKRCRHPAVTEQNIKGNTGVLSAQGCQCRKIQAHERKNGFRYFFLTGTAVPG